MVTDIYILSLCAKNLQMVLLIVFILAHLKSLRRSYANHLKTLRINPQYYSTVLCLSIYIGFYPIFYLKKGKTQKYQFPIIQ